MTINKKYLLPAIITIIFVLAVFIYINTIPKSNPENISSQTPPPYQQTPNFQPSEFGNWVTVTPGTDISRQQIQKLLPHLPIKINQFQTSVKIITSINIYTLPSDPDAILHLDIFGPNYYQSDSSTQNPNATAFKESFLKAKQIIASYNTDINQLQIVYGNRQYIQQTALNWIETLGLLN